MTRIVENADSFVEDALEGFARVHADIVRRVDGGIVRSHPLAPGRVAVVIGGGSGHYPAFAGLVGEGLAAGAVCGNIFSSPSAGQAYRVAEAAEAGGGVLFSYGNYAGDVIHFGEAEHRLNAAGIHTRTVLVTDDVASAGADEIDRRRGIAGDLCVFRIAGAAAEATRLIGVARDVVAASCDELGRLDAVAGDGDHGIGMLRGLEAATSFAKAQTVLGVEQLLAGAGEAWSEQAGGTSGALWGAALAAMGASLGDREAYTPDELRAAVAAALARVQQLGGAVVGDKTMIDALVPFDAVLAEHITAGATLAAALAAAATAAEQGAAATAALTPRLGRARPLAERSKGHVDPGATSLALIARAIATEVSS